MYGQKHNVTLVQMNCEIEVIDIRYRHFELFNLEGNKIPVDINESEKLKYKKLEFGKYKAKFINKYGQNVNIELLINQKEITLCTDQFIPTSNPSLLDNFYDSDNISIQLESLDASIALTKNLKYLTSTILFMQLTGLMTKRKRVLS